MTNPCQTVNESFRHRVAHAPAMTVLISAEGQWTFADWDQRANSIACGLYEAGARPGERYVALFGQDRWLTYAATVIAIHKVGGVVVPASAKFTSVQIERVVTHCGARAVLCPEDLAASGFSCPTWAPDDLSAGNARDRFDDVSRSPDDLAEIIYTSGTTGDFKGVACSHASLTYMPAGIAPKTVTRAGRGELFLHWSPIGTNASQGVLHNILRAGHMTAITSAEYQPAEACATVIREKVVAMGLSPAMAQLFVEVAETGEYDLSSLRRVTVTGAAAPPMLLERLAAALAGAEIVNGYGLTEAGFAGLRMAWNPRRGSAIGRADEFTQVRILDDRRVPLPDGEAGELWLRAGDAPTRSYYLDDAATADVYDDGWVRTGDLAYRDDEGYVHLVDRKKDVIISGGLNISSLEVEEALAAHPSVREAAVVGIPHPVLGEVPGAAVVLTGDATADELPAHVRNLLGENKTPHRVMTVTELPRTISGKVRKGELRTIFELNSPGRVLDPPQTPTERALAEIWKSLLDLDAVGVNEDFIEMGGHSVIAVQLLTRLRQELKVHVPLRAIFEAPTIRSFGVIVDRAQMRKTDWQHAPRPNSARDGN